MDGKKSYLRRESGVSILEVLIASTILVIVIWGSVSFIVLNMHQRRRQVAQNASNSFVPAIADDLSGFVRSVMYWYSIQSPVGWCNGATPNFTNPMSVTDANDCLSFFFGQAWFLHVILPSTAYPANYPQDANAMKIWNKCQTSLLGGGSGPWNLRTLSRTGPLYFCEYMYPAPYATNTSPSDRDNLMAMQPIIVEATFYWFMNGLDPSGCVTAVGGTACASGPPCQASFAQYQCWNTAKTTNAASGWGPMTANLYYTVHWLDKESGASYFLSRSGYTTTAQ